MANFVGRTGIMSKYRWSKSTAMGLGAVLMLALFSVFAVTQLSANANNGDLIRACVDLKSDEITIIAASESCGQNQVSTLSVRRGATVLPYIEPAVRAAVGDGGQSLSQLNSALTR